MKINGFENTSLVVNSTYPTLLSLQENDEVISEWVSYISFYFSWNMNKVSLILIDALLFSGLMYILFRMDYII